MSRTSKNNNANRVPSPIRYYISFSGERGTFSYWDSANKERVDLGSDINFVVLDTKSAITGWNDAANARIYSNRVSSVTKEELSVKCGNTVLVKGMYADIKEKIKAEGGKFCTEVFALVDIGGEYQPAQIDLTGVSLGCWMSFVDELGGSWATYAFLISTSKGEQKKKGRVEFIEVKFKASDLPSDLNEMANAFNDDMLQPYLAPRETQEEAVAV